MMNTPSAQSAHLPARSLQPGEKVGKFEIVEQIGAGGMSIVWKGYDRLLDRHVAIKQFHVTFEGPDGEELHDRFRREAQIQKQLAQHSDLLAKIIDVLDNERGLFIVMEYVDGVSLERLLAEQARPIEPRRALGIVAAAALALETIHKQGVLHGDLKPSNILLPRQGGLKVVDFGLASLMQDQEALSLGTVRYMAPERFGGEAVDGRSDMYALGMIAYEMLAGRDGFNDAFKVILRDQRNQALRWMKWHSNHRAKAPPLHQLNADISPTLSELVARMMEKDPAQRVGSGAELIEAIRRHFAGGALSPEATGLQTVSTAGVPGPPGPGQAAVAAAGLGDSAPTAPVPRHRNFLPLVLGVLLVVLVSLGAWVWYDAQREQQSVMDERREQAMAVFHAARDAYDEGDYATAGEAFGQLAQVWGSDDIGRHSRAYASLSLGQGHLELAEYDQAVEAFEQAMAVGVLPVTKVDRLIREATSRRAFVQETGRIERLIQDHQLGRAQQDLLELRQHALTQGELDQIDAFQERIDQSLYEGRVGSALARARELVQAGERDQAIAFLDQEYDRRRDERLSAQAAELRRLRQIDELLAAASAAEAVNDWSMAIERMEEAVRLTQEQDERDLTPRLTRLQAQQAHAQARAFENAGNYRRALQAYERSLEMTELPGAEQARDRVERSLRRAELITQADAAMRRGEYGDAAEAYAQARAIESSDDLERRYTRARVRLLTEQARADMEEQAFDQARRKLSDARRLAEDDAEVAVLTSRLEDLVQYHQHLREGDEHRRAGRFGSAKVAYRRARQVMDTPEIETRLADTDYEQLLAQARAHIAQEHWVSAWAILQAADRLRQSEELNQLKEQVRPHVRERES